MIAHRLEQPVLVVAAEADDVGAGVAAERKDGLDAVARVRTAIDVITEKDDGVVRVNVRQLRKQIDEGLTMTMNVANCERGHRAGSRGRVASALS